MTDKIDEIIEYFERTSTDRLGKMLRFVMTQLEEEILRQQIQARVASRVKSSAGLREKLEKWSQDEKMAKRLDGTPNEVLSRVNDLAAARVMTYTEEDREAIEDMVKAIFASPRGYKTPFDLERKESHDRIKNNKRNHYRATHMMIALREVDLSGGYKNLKQDKCELQISSLLAHVWNEIEHDTVYKTLSGELSEPERDAIDALGLLTKTGDIIIKNLLASRDMREARERERQRIDDDRFSNPKELSEWLRGHFGPKVAGRPIDYAGGCSDFLEYLQALDWDHPRDVKIKFSPSALKEARKETMGLCRFLERNNRSRPSIDPNSMDLFSVATLMMESETLGVKFKDVRQNRREVTILRAFVDKNS